MAKKKATTKTRSKASGSTRAAAPSEGVIELGNRRELFVDDYLIDRMRGVELRLQKPVPRDLAIVHDAPWEGNTSGYHTVFQDGGLFRMYYRGSMYHQFATSAKPVVCYAESRDGKEWYRPELGLVSHMGSRRNNIIWDGPGSLNFTPFRDTNPACRKGEEYKALGSPHSNTREDQALVAFKSPDGVHWDLISDKPVMDHTTGVNVFDSQNVSFWDPARGCYVEFHRDSIYPDGVRYRQIMTCTSKDYRRWSKQQLLDYADAPLEHLYTNAVNPYYRAPHIYVGFPKRLRPDRSLVGCTAGGMSDGLFMTSRDGLHFKRWSEAFVRPGLQRSRWENRNNMTALGILETENDLPTAPKELSIFSSEGFYSDGPAQLRRYTLRLDGFVAANAPLKGGELVTRPFTFDAQALNLNVSTSVGGSARVEIQDADGTALKGYSLRDCDEIYGDFLDLRVSWKGAADLSALAGKPLRLRFALSDADLYSFRFGWVRGPR